MHSGGMFVRAYLFECFFFSRLNSQSNKLRFFFFLNEVQHRIDIFDKHRASQRCFFSLYLLLVCGRSGATSWFVIIGINGRKHNLMLWLPDARAGQSHWYRYMRSANLWSVIGDGETANARCYPIFMNGNFIRTEIIYTKISIVHVSLYAVFTWCDRVTNSHIDIGRPLYV